MKEPKFKTPNQPTMQEIITLINSIVSRSERSIREDFKKLGIKQLGKRQSPQRYPATAPWQVLAALGYPVAADKLPPLDTAATRLLMITKSEPWRRIKPTASQKRKAGR